MTELEQLERLLRGHDWYYQYSDDYNVFRRGQSERSAIRFLVEKLGLEGEALYREYRCG